MYDNVEEDRPSCMSLQADFIVGDHVRWRLVKCLSSSGSAIQQGTLIILLLFRPNVKPLMFRDISQYYIYRSRREVSLTWLVLSIYTLIHIYVYVQLSENSDELTKFYWYDLYLPILILILIEILHIILLYIIFNLGIYTLVQYFWKTLLRNIFKYNNIVN